MSANTTITCPDCNGYGNEYLSCCGDDIRGLDVPMCPTCHEHQGDEQDQAETCETCNGTGKVPVESFTTQPA